VADLDQARTAAEDRRHRMRTRQLAAGPKATLESLLSKIEQGKTSEVPLIIKADVQGSIEALTGSLEKLSTTEAKVNILHAAVGGITTGDVTLAEASAALIIGFNVVPDSSARQMAEDKGVDIRVYRVIYDIVDDVHKALEEGLTPEIREETLGRAEVRQVFKVSRVGTIAGCHVLDGVVNRNARVRVIRNNIVVMDERTLESLKRFKDDVREVRSGMECGLKIAGFDDIKEGDTLEFYKTVEVARSL
jgi:translation initiation factor IF-2